MTRDVRRERSDEGVAAVEMALVSSLVLLLAFAALPLYSLASTYQRTNNLAAGVLRYATSVDANAHETAPGSGVFTRRPTSADITRYVEYAAKDEGYSVSVNVCDPAVPGASLANCKTLATRSPASGDTVVVTVSHDVDLTVLGSLANAIGKLTGGGDIAPSGVVTITATSQGREE